MSNSNWLKEIQKKLMRKPSTEFHANVMFAFKEEKKRNSETSTWSFLFAPALAMGLVIFIFVSSYQQRLEFPLTNPQIFSTLNEHDEMLENLDTFSEIDHIESLSDADWEILLSETGANGV